MIKNSASGCTEVENSKEVDSEDGRQETGDRKTGSFMTLMVKGPYKIGSFTLTGYEAVWRILDVLMRIRIPLFKLMRIQIRSRIQQKIIAREREKKFLPNLHFFLLNNLTQLFMHNFLTNNEEGGARGEG